MSDNAILLALAGTLIVCALFALVWIVFPWIDRVAGGSGGEARSLRAADADRRTLRRALARIEELEAEVRRLGGGDR